MNRFGKEPVGGAGRSSWCTVPPKFVRIPRAKPAELHGPHQAAYQVPFVTASCVVEWPAPVSPTIFQSHDDAPHVVSQPLFWLSHTNCPPAYQCVGDVASASNGAMKRAPGSHGLGVYVNAKHDGEISRKEFEPGAPLETPPFVVNAMSRSTYSTTARLPFVWSTSVSPPSPPNGETIVEAPGRSNDSPLSCSPPHNASPPVTGPASA